MRISKVVKKETIDFLRDKGFILTIILEPLLLILVFGYTFQADINHLNTIVIDNDHSNYSEKVISAIESSEYFKVIKFSGSLEDAKSTLSSGKVRAVYYIPDDFSEKLKNATKAEIYLYIDSSDYTVYNILKGASGQVVKDSLQDIVQLIVSDLETERDAKQKSVNDIQELVNSIDAKANSTLSKVSSLIQQFSETRILISDSEKKIDSTSQDIDTLIAKLDSFNSQINESMEGLESLKQSLNDMKNANPASAQSIDKIIIDINLIEYNLSSSYENILDIKQSGKFNVSKEYLNFDDFNHKLNNNEAEVNDINKTANEIQQTYKDIQKKMDTIHLELRTLKKDFLSFPMDINKKYMYGEVTYFQYLTPAIITLILFFIGVVLTTINIVDERNSKTLFRIATTPLKKWELFGGKFIVFFIVGIIEAIYVLLLALLLFNVQIAGNILSAFLVLILLMAASIGLGLLISAIVKTMRQAIMLVPLVVIPAVLISQTFSPIEVMPSFMQKVAYISPMLYSNIALREIMIKGTSITGVLPQLLILAAYAIITLFLGIMISKKRIE